MPATISKDKTRILITLDREDKERLEQIAKDDTRSLNNLIVKILKDYLRNMEDKKK